MEDQTSGSAGAGGDSARRLAVLHGHLRGTAARVQPAPCAAVDSSAPLSSSKDEVQKAFPRRRQDALKWNGWGYRDSCFYVNERIQAAFKGTGRYPEVQHEMPLFRPWLEAKVGFDVNVTSYSQPHPLPKDIPPPLSCSEFVEDIRQHCVAFSTDGSDRLFRSHGPHRSTHTPSHQ